MNDPKIVIFANCHGYYIERDLYKYIPELKNNSIKRFVSFEDLDKFDKVKPCFTSADLIIIQPISNNNYYDFSIENILKIKKSEAKVISFPYARFNGYFPAEVGRPHKLQPAVVESFPILPNQYSIDDFLQEQISEEKIINHFENCLTKLKEIEKRSDIPFVDFFLKYHQEYPMFKDYKHPTPNLVDEISNRVVIKSSKILNLKKEDRQIQLNKSPKQSGHYMPIQDKVKSVLNLKYNLEDIFVTSRKKYMESVINYELNPNTTETNDYTFFEQNFLLKK